MSITMDIRNIEFQVEMDWRDGLIRVTRGPLSITYLSPSPTGNTLGQPSNAGNGSHKLQYSHPEQYGNGKERGGCPLPFN
ncbi:hypothetical protein CEXT_493451 [Caerostris extrusa]|uniref:Uncharacterized protein n=1 Tax=Caerostris extrusa TaxID=172846 RepID=A0AAV4WB12_CAEEX|nr:hypothetical protein CEXT_493451 [Caerostris extrusa]